MKILSNLLRGLRAPLGVGAAFLCAHTALAPSSSAQGLTIVRNFGGGSPPANLAGGGNLQDIFHAACDWWERTLCSPDHTVTITYLWQGLGGGTLGVHTLLSQGGNPNRETSGRIVFDNDGSSPFFADPTPTVHSEYFELVTNSNDFGGGVMNIGRRYIGPSGAASGRIDLFTVVLHEVGHALGLSSANTAFVQEAGADREVNVTAPRPFPGSAIPIDASSAHLATGRSLMFASAPANERKLPSAADVVTNAQLSKYTQAMTLIPVAGSAVVRNGTGVNPTGFVQVTRPVIGEDWITTVDISNGAANSIVFIGLGGPTQVSLPQGELLAASPHFVVSIAPGTHTGSIPFDCSFVGRTMPAQGATLGPPALRLHNALDITVGSH